MLKKWSLSVASRAALGAGALGAGALGAGARCAAAPCAAVPFVVALFVALGSTFVVQGQAPRRAAPAPGDWPELRGPSRDGISTETGLLSTWKLNGENFLWRASYGGRSAPIVMGNRVYVQNPAGRGTNLQERVMALDADTGKVVWEYKFNIFQSDAPPHRIGWASPAALQTETQCFPGDRAAVRRQAVVHALQGLLDRLAG